MTEPTCDSCFLSPTCFIRRRFDKFLFDVRSDFTDREQLPLETAWHKVIAKHCRHFERMGLDETTL